MDLLANFDRPGSDAAAPTAPPTFGYHRVVTGAAVLLGCFAVLGRAFAQVGIAPVNLFVGEAALIALVWIGPTRAALGAAVRGLWQPGPLHTLLWAGTVFVAYGLFETVRGTLIDPSSALEAGKNFVFNYLIVFLVGGIAIGALDRTFLARLARWLPWANGIFIIVVRLLLRNVTISIPGSQMEGVTYGLACFVSLALLVCYDEPLGRRWYLYALNGFCLLYVQVRAWWFAAAIGLLLWAVLRRRVRHLVAVGCLGLAVLTVMAVADVSVPGPPDRGGAVSIQALAGRTIAPLDPTLAAQLTPEAQVFKDTTEWRQRWWREIWHTVHDDQARTLFGYGYGFRLSSLVPYIPEVIRTPHNVFMYALGYGGWLGVATFALFQALLARAMWAVYRATGNPFGLIVWAMGFVAGNFENFFETPYMAVPFYFLAGLALSPVAGDIGDAARQAASRRRGAVVLR